MTNMTNAALHLLMVLAFPGLSGLMAQKPGLRIESVILPAHAPIATIECFFEDSQGFLWIGAYTGLYRYDGYALRHYRYDPKNPYSISDNKIRRIAEDAQGNFWVGTQLGMNYFDRQHQRFKHYSDTAAHGIGKVWISDVRLDTNGTPWVATRDGLYRFDAITDRFVRVFPETGIANIVSVAPVRQGTYLARTNALLYRPHSGDTIFSVPIPPDMLRSLYPDDTPTDAAPDGWLWVATTNGLLGVNIFTRQATEVQPLKGARVSTMTRRGEHWFVCSTKGIFRLHAQTHAVEGPLPVQLNGADLPETAMRISYAAPNGMLWMTNFNYEVFTADKRKERFRHAPIDLMKSMQDPALLCELYEYAPGVMLIPRSEGPCLFELNSGNITPFPFTPSYNLNGWKQGITCFLEEPNGHLWIGTRGGVFLLDKRSKRFVHLEQQFEAMQSIRSVALRKIHRDRKGRLWLATWENGLIQVDFNKKTIRQYNNTEQDKADYLQGSRTILEARNGDLWFGTRGGLLKYIEKEDSFLVYRHILNDPTSMSENTSFCLYEDTDGTIWSGSYGGGLNRLDVQTGKFRYLTTDDGLLDNNVFSLLPDRHNNLWMLNFNGVSMLDTTRRVLRTFKYTQGLLNTNFDAFLYGSSRYSNNLFFGGTKGVDYFDPDNLLERLPPPRVWFTAFKLFNEPVRVAEPGAGNGTFALAKEIGLTDRITLRHDQNVLTFEFAALDYASPQTIQYAYQLVGFDTAWQYIGDKRSVTFTNLNPGAYTLKVKASSNDGAWDTEERNVRALTIVVTPPWWRTWWFRLALLVGTVALVTSVYRYRIRQIREREALKTALNRRIAQVKLEALRSQMNPHFVFNCLSSLKLFVEKGQTEKASDHIGKFAALLRRVLDDARMDTETVALEREVDTLRRYVELEQIRFKEKFEFRMEISPDMDLQNLEIPPLILQPYVENAILHGLQHKIEGKGLLWLRVEGGDTLVKIVVEDNGIGREAAQIIKAKNPTIQTAHGLQVTAERLAYFSQKYGIQTQVETADLFDAAGAPAGTHVTLTFQTNE